MSTPTTNESETAIRAWLATLTAGQLAQARRTVARSRTREGAALRDWIAEELARR